MKSFEDIKVGDTVVVDTSSRSVWGCSPSFIEVTVSRITATQIISEYCRWRRSDGRQVGISHYDGHHIVLGEEAYKLKESVRFYLAKRNAERAISQHRRLDCKSIKRMRAAADEAEAYLRAVGEWRDE